uniref:F-box domain-containing protein n=1 Tax=Chromera velia CCMP2878 TaxID=1169474 RepID=A0A0G4G5N5_9ALVE|mmetsp:Transcript_33806/g.66939  ORF Transcript_33806/g.66939 Transcript_33806/m.66939 type:complete len:218 (-) Transcript_33806:670-1323(-)|eukprot:Cvel_20333.t1-p1 / transcript=Cvel_20333.t1 / gene=Cvel_20333 / organism=Chromera_velia_CCMP2878 / gene_product=hypothetical protein / transcript_product=hypothetical protein / location=Cvel_scaffold1816:28767-29417(-) / protein_length=217 / sequence_SO=supercontig / SO=protein_coding / is_pseudo=false
METSTEVRTVQDVQALSDLPEAPLSLLMELLGWRERLFLLAIDRSTNTEWIAALKSIKSLVLTNQKLALAVLRLCTNATSVEISRVNSNKAIVGACAQLRGLEKLCIDMFEFGDQGETVEADDLLCLDNVGDSLKVLHLGISRFQSDHGVRRVLSRLPNLEDLRIGYVRATDQFDSEDWKLQDQQKLHDSVCKDFLSRNTVSVFPPRCAPGVQTARR